MTFSSALRTVLTGSPATPVRDGRNGAVVQVEVQFCSEKYSKVPRCDRAPGNFAIACWNLNECLWIEPSIQDSY